MAKNIDDLRNHLFGTLDALRDKTNPMDLDRARAVADVAKVIVESAKVEVAMLNATGGFGTGFVPEEKERRLNGVSQSALGPAARRPA